jgi:hypothetical protein
LDSESDFDNDADKVEAAVPAASAASSSSKKNDKRRESLGTFTDSDLEMDVSDNSVEEAVPGASAARYSSKKKDKGRASVATSIKKKRVETVASLMKSESPTSSESLVKSESLRSSVWKHADRFERRAVNPKTTKVETSYKAVCLMPAKIALKPGELCNQEITLGKSGNSSAVASHFRSQHNFSMQSESTSGEGGKRTKLTTGHQLSLDVFGPRFGQGTGIATTEECMKSSIAAQRLYSKIGAC